MKKIATILAFVLGIFAVSSCDFFTVKQTYFYQISLDQSFVQLHPEFSMHIIEFQASNIPNGGVHIVTNPPAGYKETFAAEEGTRKIKVVFYFGNSVAKWYPRIIELSKGETIKLNIDSTVTFSEVEPA